MKSMLVIAGVAVGLIVSPLSLASAHRHFTPKHGVATVTVKCNANFKSMHRVKFMVVAGKHHMMTFKKIHCGKTKSFAF